MGGSAPHARPRVLMRKRVARKVLRQALYEPGERLPRIITAMRAYQRLCGGRLDLPYGWEEDDWNVYVAPGGTRTRTLPVLNQAPLPV